MTADEVLAVLNPNNEPIRKVPAFAKVIIDGKEQFVESDETEAVVEADPDNPGQYRILSFMSKQYGVVQLEDQFRFLDEVVGTIGGSHYEAGVRLRKGKQVCLTIDTGAAILDPNERGDVIQKYIWGFNSFDGSWAFRVKTGNFRVECANMAAMALRGSSDSVVSGDWSTRHTTNIMARTAAAKQVLGLWVEYNDLFFAQAEQMIQTPITDNVFSRLLDGLFTATKNDNVTEEKNVEAIEQTRVIYELSPTTEKIRGTVWGALNSLTEWNDWYQNVRGSASASIDEMRFRKQMDSSFKQEAWDRCMAIVNG